MARRILHTDSLLGHSSEICEGGWSLRENSREDVVMRSNYGKRLEKQVWVKADQEMQFAL